MEARERYEEALPIFREIEDRLGEANTLLGLGRLHLAKGEIGACRAHLETCLKQYAELGDPEGLWETRLVEARCLAAEKRTTEARAVAGAVRDECRAAGHHLLAREAEDLRQRS